MENIQALNEKFNNSNPEEILEYFTEHFKNRIAFASSFSIEDQVITKMIVDINKETNIFTLDTGRLPYETYKLIENTNSFFDIKIDVYFPEFNSVQKIVKEKGINLFHNSVEDRKLCCNVRKVEPLKRALRGHSAWITGLRREQSITRNNLEPVEVDDNFGLIKINPLINWSEEEVWSYIKKHNIPYNNLYNQNYKSIGCAPCTRAVREGGDVREGRWWWENPDTKECGLHLNHSILPNDHEEVLEKEKGAA